MRTPLAKQAFNNVLQFKEDITPVQFAKIEEGISNFDSMVTGFGFDAIQADHKLKAIAKLSKEELLEAVKSL